MLRAAMLLAMFRTFLVFLLGGLLIATAVITLFLIGHTVWLDCLDDNPTLTCGDALLFVVVSPLYGIGIAMALYFLPLIVGTALAVLGRAILGYVPLWYVMVILPVCVLAYNVVVSPQRRTAPAMGAPSDVLGHSAPYANLPTPHGYSMALLTDVLVASPSEAEAICRTCVTSRTGHVGGSGDFDNLVFSDLLRVLGGPAHAHPGDIDRATRCCAGRQSDAPEPTL
jgi:hypothetical protein